MVDNLKRFREPIAWAFVAVVVGSMLLSIVRLVLAMTTEKLPVFAGFQDIANNSMNLTLVALLAAMVCLCLFIAPATPHAVALARWAAIVVTLGTLLTIVATALGLWASPGIFGVVLELLGGVLDIVLKIVACVVLWVIYRAVKAGRMAPPAVAEPDLPVRAITDEAPPVWQPGQAAGSVWKTAAEAAAGSSADAPAPHVPTASDAAGAPRSGWTTPQGRAGAAEALGWRRVDDASASGTAGAPAPGDTP